MIRKTESKLQSDCFLWFNKNYCTTLNNPRYKMFQVPNEIAMSLGGHLKTMGVSNAIIEKALKRLYADIKAMGFSSGVSDTIIVAPNKVYFIEFKLPENNQQPNQKDFECIVTELGHYYAIIKTLEQFKSFVDTIVLPNKIIA